MRIKKVATYHIKKNTWNNTQLTNGINYSETSLHSAADYSCISSNASTQENIKVDPCPLRFDNLVDYFETSVSDGQQVRFMEKKIESSYEASNIGGSINRNKVFNARTGKLYKVKNMKFYKKYPTNSFRTLKPEL